jgi:dTDP-4-dehydrorhamnose 3,5-epimerase
MEFSSLAISGATLVQFPRYGDSRGFFQEAFKLSEIMSALNSGFVVKQVNQSRSAAGVVRGIHWADAPPGQEKYLMVQSGSIIDFVVDLRADSPTFGRYDFVELRADQPGAILIGNGVGHAFLSLEDGTTVTYLCSEEYNPPHEHGINPLDPEVALPLEDLRLKFGLPKLSFSEKDLQAPSLAEQLVAKRVPVVF